MTTPTPKTIEEQTLEVLRKIDQKLGIVAFVMAVVLLVSICSLIPLQ